MHVVVNADVVKHSDWTSSLLCSLQAAETWRRCGRWAAWKVVAGKVWETVSAVWRQLCQNWRGHR